MGHQTRKNLSFAEKPSDADMPLRRGAKQQYFQRHKTIDPEILSTINHTGRAAADLSQNLQSREFNREEVQSPTSQYQAAAQIFDRRSAVKLCRTFAVDYGTFNFDAPCYQRTCDKSLGKIPCDAAPGAMLCRSWQLVAVIAERSLGGV
jgi:hypothetical protein